MVWRSQAIWMQLQDQWSDEIWHFGENHWHTYKEGNGCLQLATAETIDRRVITGYYAKPTNYTMPALVSQLVGGHEALLSGNHSSLATHAWLIAWASHTYPHAVAVRSRVVTSPGNPWARVPPLTFDLWLSSLRSLTTWEHSLIRNEGADTERRTGSESTNDHEVAQWNDDQIV